MQSELEDLSGPRAPYLLTAPQESLLSRPPHQDPLEIVRLLMKREQLGNASLASPITLFGGPIQFR